MGGVTGAFEKPRDVASICDGKRGAVEKIGNGSISPPPARMDAQDFPRFTPQGDVAIFTVLARNPNVLHLHFFTIFVRGALHEVRLLVSHETCQSLRAVTATNPTDAETDTSMNK